MDNGWLADFRWLDAIYPHARFVLNARGLKSWLVSRLDHVARHTKVAYKRSVAAQNQPWVPKVRRCGCRGGRPRSPRRCARVGHAQEPCKTPHTTPCDEVVGKKKKKLPASTRKLRSPHKKVAHKGLAHHGPQILSAAEGALRAAKCPPSSWDDVCGPDCVPTVFYSTGIKTRCFDCRSTFQHHAVGYSYRHRWITWPSKSKHGHNDLTS